MILTGRGAEQQSKGVDTVLACINLTLALGQVGQAGQRLRLPDRPGQRPGRPRARPEGRPASRLPADRESTPTATPWRRSGASIRRRCRGRGRARSNCSTRSGRPGGIRGAARDGVERRRRVAATRAASIDRLQVARLPRRVRRVPERDGRTRARRPAGLPVGRGRGHDDEPRRPRDPPAACGPRRRPASAATSTCCANWPSGSGAGTSSPSPRRASVFDEFRRATAGGTADYTGITYERIDREDGVFWPCPTEDHPGTPRLFAERFHHAGRARRSSSPVEHRPAGEEPDADVPALLHHRPLQGALQLRRADPAGRRSSPAAKPRPRAADAPAARPAARRRRPAAAVTVESRRGRVEFAAEVTADIRPDTLFAPFHWGGREAANLLTNPALDPISRMPEFKLAAVRIAARPRRPEARDVTRKQLAIIGNGMAAGRLLDELAPPRRAAAVRHHRVRRGAARLLQPHPARPRAGRRRRPTRSRSSRPAWYAEQRRHASAPARAVATARHRRAPALAPPTATTHPYDVAVFATGSVPLVPPLDGLKRADGEPKAGVVRVPHGRRLRADARATPGRRRRRGASAAGCSGSRPPRRSCDLGLHVTVVHLADTLMNRAGRPARRRVPPPGGRAARHLRPHRRRRRRRCSATDRVEGVRARRRRACCPADLRRARLRRPPAGRRWRRRPACR